MQIFKFQKRSCKLSFLFLSRRQHAQESLLVGYDDPIRGWFGPTPRPNHPTVGRSQEGNNNCLREVVFYEIFQL